MSRRLLLQAGGFVLAGLPIVGFADGVTEILMVGDARGSTVRFAPRGLLVPPGTTIQWRNADPGNAHTTTAFHPANQDHTLRIPPAAEPWNSDYLLENETFAITLTIPGVYDYYCIPHEMAGMVGRIVVTQPGAAPQAAPGMEGAFPSVASIIRSKEIDP